MPSLFGDKPKGTGATTTSRALFSPLTFQGEPLGESSVLKISRPGSLDVRSGQPSHGQAPKVKTFSLFKFYPEYESVGSSGLMRAEDDTTRWGVFSPQDFCGGVAARSGHFCTKEDCEVQSHRTKAWQDGRMLPGFYVLDARQQRAYLKPFLPMAVGLKTSTARAVLSEGEQTMEAWAAIFRHLCDSEDQGLPLEGEEELGDELDGASEGDYLLCSFAAAMKTPGGCRDIGNPLTTPAKRLRLNDIDEEDSVRPSPPGDKGLIALAYALAIVKGKLGSKEGDINYNTVHGGIRAVTEGLAAIEHAQLEVEEDQRKMREDQRDGGGPEEDGGGPEDYARGDPQGEGGGPQGAGRDCPTSDYLGSCLEQGQRGHARSGAVGKRRWGLQGCQS